MTIKTAAPPFGELLARSAGAARKRAVLTPAAGAAFVG